METGPHQHICCQRIATTTFQQIEVVISWSVQKKEESGITKKNTGH